ncbi:hypothetical protein Tco_0682508 [Tanacetum coccineum]|uniref:Uncharacterized protein n=1 Tax=Tanacetum coccineum TaxID=301880 RepID=A0ABQ4XSR9_9ASTR
MTVTSTLSPITPLDVQFDTPSPSPPIIEHLILGIYLNHMVTHAFVGCTTFVPIESKDDRAIPKLAAESSKRFAEEELDQQSSKKQKTGESSKPRDKEVDELSQEELHQMMIITLGCTRRSSVGNHNEVNQFFDDMLKAFDIDDLVMLWSLKHIHDLTWKLYDLCGVHHVSTEKGIDINMLVEKEYPLSRGTLTLMLIAKLLVKQDNEMSRELLRKIFL